MRTVGSSWNHVIIFVLFITGCCGIHDMLTTVGQSASSKSTYDSTTSDLSLIPDGTNTFTGAGTLYGFQYFTNGYSGTIVRFQIWRVTSGYSYSRVYESSDVTLANSSSSQSYILSTSVSVQAGDTIGFYYPGDNPIPYDNSSCGSSNLPYYFSGTPSSATFKNLTSFCRQYALTAQVIYNSNSVFNLKCTALTAATYFQTLTSPNYTETSSYATDLNECWIFSKLDTSATYTLEITYNIQDAAAGSCADFLNLIQGTTTLGTSLYEWCGTQTSTLTVQSTASNLYLRFKTDSTDGGNSGFVLYYKASATSSTSSSSTSTVAIIVGTIFTIVAVALLVVVAIIWIKVRNQRARLDRKPLASDMKTAASMESLHSQRGTIITPATSSSGRFPQPKAPLVFLPEERTVASHTGYAPADTEYPMKEFSKHKSHSGAAVFSHDDEQTSRFGATGYTPTNLATFAHDD